MNLEQQLIKTKKILFHTIWINALIWFSICVFMRLELASVNSLAYFLGAIIEAVGLYVILLCFTVGKINPYIRYGFHISNYEKGWVLLSVMVAFVERIFTMYMIYFQQKFGVGFQVGGNQVTGLELHFDQFFITGIVAPIVEEFIFRVLMFAIFAWMIQLLFKTFKLNKWLRTNVQWFDVYNLRSKVCWAAILISSTLFSMAHGPDLTSFHFYALGGLVGAVLFLKFGYWAAVIQHFAYNYLTFLFFIAIEFIMGMF